jgi:hypothetical protein
LGAGDRDAGFVVVIAENGKTAFTGRVELPEIEEEGAAEAGAVVGAGQAVIGTPLACIGPVLLEESCGTAHQAAVVVVEESSCAGGTEDWREAGLAPQRTVRARHLQVLVVARETLAAMSEIVEGSVVQRGVASSAIPCRIAVVAIIGTLRAHQRPIWIPELGEPRLADIFAGAGDAEVVSADAGRAHFRVQAHRAFPQTAGPWDGLVVEVAGKHQAALVLAEEAPVVLGLAAGEAVPGFCASEAVVGAA